MTSEAKCGGNGYRDVNFILNVIESGLRSFEHILTLIKLFTFSFPIGPYGAMLRVSYFFYGELLCPDTNFSTFVALDNPNMLSKSWEEQKLWFYYLSPLPSVNINFCLAKSQVCFLDIYSLPMVGLHKRNTVNWLKVQFNFTCIKHKCYFSCICNTSIIISGAICMILCNCVIKLKRKIGFELLSDLKFFRRILPTLQTVL